MIRRRMVASVAIAAMVLTLAAPTALADTCCANTSVTLVPRVAMPGDTVRLDGIACLGPDNSGPLPLNPVEFWLSTDRVPADPNPGDAPGNPDVHLADDLIAGSPGCLSQMAEQHALHGGSVVAVEEVPRENTSSYGIVEVDDNNRITGIVEKPAPQDAPSTSAVVGRYLLLPEIFDKLERTGRGAGGEIQLTDGIADLLGESAVYAYAFSGTRYDCGSKLGYLQATVAFGLEHPKLGTALRAHLEELLRD